MYSDLSSFLLTVILEFILETDNLAIIVILARKCNNPKIVTICGIIGSLGIKAIILQCLSFIVEIDEIVFMNIYSMKDICLFAGGIFLIIIFLHQNNKKIQNKMEINKNKNKDIVSTINIILADIIFSLDSVIAAISVTLNIKIILLAFVISTAAMCLFATQFLAIMSKYKFLEKNIKYLILIISFKLILDGIKVKELYQLLSAI